MSKWIWILAMATSVLLVGCGSSALRGDKCQSQPLLPLWMITSGVFLFIIGATTAVAYVRGNKLAKNSVFLSIGWAFCWGLVLLVGYLIWFAIWIAGSYFTIDAIRTMKVDHFGCERFTIGVAGASVLIIWLVFFYICVSLARLLLASTKRRKTNEEEAEYAAVQPEPN